MTHTYESILARTVGVGRNISDVVSETSLSLLRNAEVTEDLLAAGKKAIDVLIAEGQDLIATLKSCNRVRPIEHDGLVDALLTSTANAIEVGIEILKNKRASTLGDSHSNSAHEDAMAFKYSALIDKMVALSKANEAVQWAILNHDADLAEDTESFTDADAAIAYLRKL